ncbi:hypothetical protein D8Y23_01845 [Microbacterium enclense]|uniref:ATP synthase protein I n=1 Tax=Microbacterium enclense TaxID=993073 RepID=A0A3S3LPP7_9MICO|nr:hypothetical protein [Microbacterium enclense]MCT2086368.1 hypothetical protein [Microbacterium enclense]RWR22718.1 hypothetical protein D8Y23_01845 [Microbacterium enclense]
MTAPLSSTPVLRATLLWSAVVTGVVLVLAVVIGTLVAGGAGAASGGIGAGVGAIFPALTAVSILIANRFYGHPAWLQIFFGVVLGGWLLKFVLVIVAFFLLLRVEWIVPPVFFFALLATAVSSLVVDLVVISRMRLPAVSETVLPQRSDPDEV